MTLVNAFAVDTDGCQSLVFQGAAEDLLCAYYDEQTRREALDELTTRQRLAFETCGVLLLLALITLH